MQDRAWRIIYLVSAVAAAVIAAAMLDAPASPTEPAGRWLEPLVLIAVSAFLFEPFFSGNGPAVANSLVALLWALTLGVAESWLVTFLVIVAGLNISALISAYLLQDTTNRRGSRNRVSIVLSQVGTGIGSWRFLLIGTLVITLVLNNAAFAKPWRISTAVLLFVLAASKFPPHELVRRLKGTAAVGGVDLAPVRVFPPHEVVVVGGATPMLAPGEVLTLEGSGSRSFGVVIGPTFFDGRRGVRLLAPDAMALLATNDIADLKASLGGADIAGTPLQDAVNELGSPGHSIYGIVGENSSIDELRVELLTEQSVSVGDLLWTLRNGKRLFWQVADASVTRVAWGGDSHRAVIVTAHQVGTWNDTRSAFDLNTRSPSAIDLVLGGHISPSHVSGVSTGQTEIGLIPGSSFPVRLDVRELSLHHAAILGVTGTGKTHLSFSLAKALTKGGTKVICVDTTGQYSTRFKDEARQIARGAVKPFLDSVEMLAIYRPDPGTNTISEGKELAENLFNWAKSQPELAEDAPARLVLMFEEAQNFVPETFVIDDFSLKAKSQATSRIIMESRKFGLGFILVSQRTAMVTKSALSQCNTVFAFQAFDQTGLDYLEGICGTSLAKGIPGLPQQTAVVMGRGLTSARPLIVRIADAPVVVQ
jgi:Helicase HerA, central domain